MGTIKKSVLITGASSGIGRYITEVLSSRGWIVWAGYRDEKIKEELLKINPSYIRPVRLDVTDINSINDTRDIIKNSGISLDVLFNNAGIALGGPIEMLNVDEVKKVYDVNFFGYIRMIQTFLPLLRESHGRIINMSSMGGLVGVPFLMPYSSSKFAVEGMSDQLRRELANQDVSVSVIEPGPIQTNIWGKSLKNSSTIFNSDGNVLPLYQPAVNNLNTLIQGSNKFAVPVTRLKKALIHATESKRPRTRYLVYKSNFLLKILIRITPDRLVDLFFRKYFKY